MTKYSMLDIVAEYRKEASQFGDSWDQEISRRLRERTSPTNVLYRAFRLFDSGQSDRADRLLQGWKETFPGDARIYHFMAIANKRRNNPCLVRRYFEEGRKVDPTDTDLLQSFFGFLLENGDNEAAVGVMDDIMSTEPNITGYINRAVLRIYLEKPGYLDDFREALRLDPKESQRCISAVANSSIDHKTHLDEMAQVMELCIDSGAASVDIYSQLAHTYLVLGRRSEARRVLETAVRSLSSEKDVVVMESTLSCLEGDLGSASDLLKSLVVVVDDQKYRNMLQTVSMEWLKNPESPKAQQPKLVNRPAVTKTTKPIKNDKEKTKRNDPCPCGSGKKFKKCCGNC